MKTVLVILDGAADEPSPVLRGKTPLQAAATPNLDRLAATGTVGRVNPTPAGQSPGSEAGIPALLGVDVPEYGRAAVEAAGRGIAVPAGESALRASLVRVSGPLNGSGTRLLEILDGEPATSTARRAAEFLEESTHPGVRLYPGAAGRHIIVGSADAGWLPAPHPFRGLPVGLAGRWPLAQPLTAALEALRVYLNGVTLWPWGGGADFCKPPRGRSPFSALVAGAELVRGIGARLDMEVPRVPGATGGLETCLASKARAALELLERHPAVAVHVEAPDLAAHRRDPLAKAAILRAVDRELIGPLMEGMPNGGRLVVTCDHGTSSVTGLHLEGPVPYVDGTPSACGVGRGDGFFEGAVADKTVRVPRDLWTMDRVTC